MSRTSTLILLGILIILTPFSGLPITFRNLLEVVFGASVVAIGLALRSREARIKQQTIEATPIPPQSPSSVSPI